MRGKIRGHEGITFRSSPQLICLRFDEYHVERLYAGNRRDLIDC